MSNNNSHLIKKREMCVIIHFLIVFLLIGLVSYSFFMFGDSPKINDGVLDISSWNRLYTFSLSGAWDFYRDQYISSETFTTEGIPSKIKLTSNLTVNNKNQISTHRIASYKLHVTGAKPGEELAVLLGYIAPAYKLYINDVLLAENGQLADDSHSLKQEVRLHTAVFTPKTSEFYLILHVSNYIINNRNIQMTIHLGTQEKIEYKSSFMIGSDFFLIGCFFIIIVFCTHFYINRRDSSMLMFAILCLLFIINISVHDSFSINLLFPYIPFCFISKLEVLTLIWIPCLYYCMLQQVYPKHLSVKLSKSFTEINILLTILALIMPVYCIIHLAYMIQAIILLLTIYTVIKLIKSRLKIKLFTYYLSSIFIMLFCLVLDIMIHNNIITNGLMQYTPFGFLMTAVLLIYVFIHEHIRNLTQREKALKQIQKTTDRALHNELKFLRTQIRPHFINNALNTIISISRHDPEEARILLVEFSKYLRSCYDFNDLNETIPLESELSYIRSYLTLEKARFQDMLDIVYEIDVVAIDIPPLVLQPLVENAIIHGIFMKQGGGIIKIYVKKEKDTVRLGVIDNGLGIDPDKLKMILNGNIENHGVGLLNINQRLRKIYHTRLNIECPEEGGTNVYMNIPIQEEQPV